MRRVVPSVERDAKHDRGRTRRAHSVMVMLVAAALGLGCQTMLEQVGVAFLYEAAELPAAQTHLDLAYRSDAAAHPDKHRLDLFVPAPGAAAWPTFVFVHGGGWTSGDRATEAAGAEVFRNIGRHFASRGVGAAIISYRLQPEVGWRDQLEDVGAAMRFLRDRVPSHGGDPDAFYLSGHSAGAWLAARTGFDPVVLEGAGFPAASLCGLALVSGAAYDLMDEETWRVGADRGYFEARFDDGRPDWARLGSVVPFVRASVPKTLILYGSSESRALRRQSEHLYELMQAEHAPVSRLVLPRQTHQSIVLTLSRDDKRAVPAIFDLMAQNEHCPARPPRG